MKQTRLVRLEYAADELARLLGVAGRLTYARVTMDNGLAIEVEVPAELEWKGVSVPIGSITKEEAARLGLDDARWGLDDR